MKYFFIALLFISSAFAAEVGQPAPAWKVDNLDGAALTAAQFKGKVVIVDFWAPWCSPCVKEIPHFVNLVKKYGSDGLVVIGVATDCDIDSVRHFIDSHEINYEMAMSADKIYSDFGMPDALPTTFLIDRNGIIRDRKIGSEPAAVYEKKVLACLHPENG